MDQIIRNMFPEHHHVHRNGIKVKHNNMKKKLSKQFSFCETGKVRPFLKRRVCGVKDIIAEHENVEISAVSPNSRHSWHLDDEDGSCTCPGTEMDSAQMNHVCVFKYW